MNLQERLIQCNKDIEVLKKQKAEIERQIEDCKQPEFGDIVVFRDNPNWVRVILYNSDGDLWAFDKYNTSCGNPKNYRKTGKTIFDNLTF